MTTAGLYFLQSDIGWYVGLSGLLHGLFVCGVAIDIEKNRWFGGLLAAGLIVKLTVEGLFGGDTNTAELIGASVVTQAHLYGSVAGLMAALVRVSYVSLKRA